jgi:DNA-binding MarR family transcriptional regulator
MGRDLPGAALNSTGRSPRSKGSDAGSRSAPAAARNRFEQEFPGGSESANMSVVALAQVGEAFLALVDKALRHHNLSRAGREALAVIEGAGQPLSPTAIAQRLIVTTASVTSLLDTLERRGFVVRLPDPRDRRKLLVELTQDGRAIVEAFLPQVVALQTAVMAPLSEPQRHQLVKLLSTVRAGLAAVDAEAVVLNAPRRGKPQHT